MPWQLTIILAVLAVFNLIRPWALLQARVCERGSELQSRKELTQPSVFGNRVIR